MLATLSASSLSTQPTSPSALATCCDSFAFSPADRHQQPFLLHLATAPAEQGFVPGTRDCDLAFFCPLCFDLLTSVFWVESPLSRSHPCDAFLLALEIQPYCDVALDFSFCRHGLGFSHPLHQRPLV